MAYSYLVEANILSCEYIQNILVHKRGQVITFTNVQSNFNEWKCDDVIALFNVVEEIVGLITN